MHPYSYPGDGLPPANVNLRTGDWDTRYGDGPAPVSPPSVDRRNGVERIASERARQVTAEGWTPDHDDEHAHGELALAAACYAMHDGGGAGDAPPSLWPWDARWWKPSDDPVRNYERAGALLAAEIDRLRRKALASIPTTD